MKSVERQYGDPPCRLRSRHGMVDRLRDTLFRQSWLCPRRTHQSVAVGSRRGRTALAFGIKIRAATCNISLSGPGGCPDPRHRT
jgi:hypothetical protein